MKMEPIEKRSYTEIKEFCYEVAKKNECTFFRGTKLPDLFPSIIPENNQFTSSELTRIENKLIRIFQFIYPESFKNRDSTTRNWLLRVRAREYGLASRLIDWANFFETALEFATNFHNDPLKCYQYVYLWTLSLDQSELLFWEDMKHYPFKDLGSYHLLRAVPFSNNIDIATHRQFVQGGNFLIQPESCYLTALNKQSYFFDKISCIKIPVENIIEIRKDLADDIKKDIENNSLMMDSCWLDSACEVINEKFLYSVNRERSYKNE